MAQCTTARLLNRLDIFRTVCAQRTVGRRLWRLAAQARFACVLRNNRQPPSFEQLMGEIRRQARAR